MENLIHNPMLNYVLEFALGWALMDGLRGITRFLFKK